MDLRLPVLLPFLSDPNSVRYEKQKKKWKWSVLLLNG